MEEQQIHTPYLYIVEPGEADNEKIVRALKMPVSVKVHINEKGTACVELRECLENGKTRFACDFEAVPSVPIPENFKLQADELKFEDAISVAVSGWIAIFLRDGVFCTDKKTEHLVHTFDLRDVSKRLAANLDEIYHKLIKF